MDFQKFMMCFKKKHENIECIDLPYLFNMLMFQKWRTIYWVSTIHGDIPVAIWVGAAWLMGAAGHHRSCAKKSRPLITVLV